ncbi:hypothetical protein Tco_0885194 [Tanacetum coccineum]
MEDKKMAKQFMNSSFEKLWYLANEDDEEETYLFDINEFLAIQIHSSIPSKSTGTHESLYLTLDEKYDAITCDFSPELEFLLASGSHTIVPVYFLDTFEEESDVFDFMEDDLFAYEVGIAEDFFLCAEQPCDVLENGDLDVYEPRQCYDEYKRMYVEAVILIDNRLVKLIDITLEQWLDLKFRDYKKVDKEIIEGVVATWLIQSCRKQFEEYMEIKRRSEKEDGYCNRGNLPRMIQVDNMVYFQNYEWYEGLENGDLKEEALKEKAILEGSWGYKNRKGNNFCSWLKESFSNYLELDYELMIKLEEYWWGKKEEEESSEDAWSNYFNNANDAIQAYQEWFDDHEPMEGDDDDIGDLDDYLIPHNASYYVDEEEQRFKERRSKLLGIPYEKPPTFKFAKFEVQFRRTSLTMLPAQSVRSSNTVALDSPYLLVLITETS